MPAGSSNAESKVSRTFAWKWVSKASLRSAHYSAATSDVPRANTAPESKGTRSTISRHGRSLASPSRRHSTVVLCDIVGAKYVGTGSLRRTLLKVLEEMNLAGYRPL